MFLRRYSLASSAESPESSSSFLRSWPWSSVSLSFSSSSSFIFSERFASFCSKASVFLSSVASFWWSLFSCREISLRLSLTSLSKSDLFLWISSFASSKASFFLLSASFSASSTILFASSSALPISASDILRLYVTPALKATIPAITAIKIPIPRPMNKYVISLCDLLYIKRE